MKTMGSVNNILSGSYLQSLFTSALQSPTGTTSQTSNSSALSLGQQSDSTQLSPFAKLLSTLQQLQQSDPTKYQQVTQQIATNLQSAAKTAQTDGNSTAANQLSQLATDFTNASNSGQLPNIQDLAQAVSGHGHHHHHHHPSEEASGDSASNSSESSSSSSSASGSSTSGSSTSGSSTSGSSTNPAQQVQLPLAWFGNSYDNNSQNPTVIILNTLSTSGITGYNT
jgi:hypothetical protein